MTRRTSERHARRIEVRFWRRGDTKAHSGFTIDVSRSGLFLGTTIMLRPGERVRLELLDHERGFVVEGEVARIHRVSLALRHLEQAGIGVRFLPPADLVHALLGEGRRRPGSARPPSAPPPTALTPPPAAASSVDGRNSPAAAAEPSPPVAAGSSSVVPVEFVDRGSFLAVYERDIAAGGLFVTTESPAPLHSTVTIELRPPLRLEHPLRFDARVVHRFDPGAGTEGRNQMSGMGVQFLDPGRVRAALAPVLSQLRH